MYLYIEDELRVEGRLHSNGETGGTKAGGGAGGSIYIAVNHLDGTGKIETTGGAGMWLFTVVKKSEVFTNIIVKCWVNRGNQDNVGCLLVTVIRWMY